MQASTRDRASNPLPLPLPAVTYRTDLHMLISEAIGYPFTPAPQNHEGPTDALRWRQLWEALDTHSHSQPCVVNLIRGLSNYAPDRICLGLRGLPGHGTVTWSPKLLRSSEQWAKGLRSTVPTLTPANNHSFSIFTYFYLKHARLCLYICLRKKALWIKKGFEKEGLSHHSSHPCQPKPRRSRNSAFSKEHGRIQCWGLMEQKYPEWVLGTSSADTLGRAGPGSHLRPPPLLFQWPNVPQRGEAGTQWKDLNLKLFRSLRVLLVVSKVLSSTDSPWCLTPAAFCPQTFGSHLCTLKASDYEHRWLCQSFPFLVLRVHSAHLQSKPEYELCPLKWPSTKMNGESVDKQPAPFAGQWENSEVCSTAW